MGLFDLVPGYQGPMVPTTNPNFWFKPNASGGWDTGINSNVGGGGGRGTGITPWLPPGAGGGGGRVGNGGSGSGFAGGVYGNGPAINHGPALPTPRSSVGSMVGTPGASGGGGFLGGLLAQIGSTPGPSLGSLPDMGIRDQGALNAQNYQHWLQQQAMNQNDQTFKWGIAALGGMGDSAKTDAIQAAHNREGQMNQDLVSRGLTNTTIKENLQSGLQRELNRQLQSVDDSTAQMLLGWLQQRQAQGPNPNSAYQMTQGAFNRVNPLLPFEYQNSGSPYGY